MAEDMQYMQQEAARRVQRMQEHSRRVFEEHQGRTPESLRAARPPQPPLYERPAAPVSVEEHRCGANSSSVTAAPCDCPLKEKTETQGGLFGGFDTEQWLLLGLALLLFRNGCRVELVLALLYLAM